MRTGAFSVVWSQTFSKELDLYTQQESLLLQAALQAYQSAETEKKVSKKVYNTGYSQAVTHPSTNPAQRCLTSGIGQELVLSAWYIHRHSGRN